MSDSRSVYRRLMEQTRVALTVDEAWEQKHTYWCPLEEVPTAEVNGGTDFGNLAEIKAEVADLAWRSKTYSNMVEEAVEDAKR